MVGLYKAAKVAEAERKNALIDEGLKILARLDADGKLNDDQKGLERVVPHFAQRLTITKTISRKIAF